jgi:hypothetical protein
MKPCFAWFAKVLAGSAGCCANLAWGEPPTLLCSCNCCNKRLKQRSSDFLQQLDDIRSSIIRHTLLRHYTV